MYLKLCNMIGFQILAAEQEDGSYLCDKVSCYMSLELQVENMWENAHAAKGLYEMFGTSEEEFKLSREELIQISKAKQCIYPDKKNYHTLACDGIVIIPKTKDKFITPNQLV
jgi:hypothetical protein